MTGTSVRWYRVLAGTIALTGNQLGRGRGHFVGRASELGAVRRRLGGVSEVVLVEGEAGIGKTLFLAEVLAEPAGFRVVHACADELDGRRPFGSLIDALDCRRSSADPLSAEIARLVDEAAAEFRIVERLSERLELMALEQPSVVALDGARWAASPTA